ncbi:MAG: oxygen-dependent coproporphyrinogen oxidase [Bacteroidota bacterium]
MDARKQFTDFIHQLQNTICVAVEELDGKAVFREDKWDRPEGGGGRTRIIQEGAVFEKGGVNISMVHGELSAALQKQLQVTEKVFFACGLSLVLHPLNPMVPTVHANFRFFELYDQNGKAVDRWFGGGADLTPYYLWPEDAVHFHQVLKQTSDPYGVHLYPQFKEACDRYFYNHHRQEARGIGGLFYDYLRDKKLGLSIDQWQQYVQAMGAAFLDGYLPIARRRKGEAFGTAEKKWQEIRRGRYVEFNLIHDKGTLFGLKSNGRIESILMSLPATVRWEYDHHPSVGSREAELLDHLQPKDWANLFSSSSTS